MKPCCALGLLLPLLVINDEYKIDILKIQLVPVSKHHIFFWPVRKKWPTVETKRCHMKYAKDNVHIHLYIDKLVSQVAGL